MAWVQILGITLLVLQFPFPVKQRWRWHHPRMSVLWFDVRVWGQQSEHCLHIADYQVAVTNTIIPFVWWENLLPGNSKQEVGAKILTQAFRKYPWTASNSLPRIEEFFSCQEWKINSHFQMETRTLQDIRQTSIMTPSVAQLSFIVSSVLS